jgi:hypothetical protein
MTQGENTGRLPHRDSGGEISWIAKNFPEVQAATIEVRCADGIWGKDERRWERTESTFRGELFACSNPRCSKGAGDATTLVRQMVRERADHREGSEACWGYEGSERLRRRRRCRHVFNFNVTILYYPS